MEKIILTIGYVPQDWNAASDGNKKIMVGDTAHSLTTEYEYHISDDGFRNLTTDKIFNGSMDDIWNHIGNDCDVLSKEADQIPTVVLENIYELCLEETDAVHRFIDLFGSGISDFSNNRKKYNGCFYCRYIVEDEDAGEIEKELLFVVKRK